jgi:hypothetical protein
MSETVLLSAVKLTLILKVSGFYEYGGLNVKTPSKTVPKETSPGLLIFEE